MAKYTMPFGQSVGHAPDAPERTATKSTGQFGEVVTYQVWPSRGAMARSIRMQQRREHRPGDWRPCVALSTTEGY